MSGPVLFGQPVELLGQLVQFPGVEDAFLVPQEPPDLDSGVEGCLDVADAQHRHPQGPQSGQVLGLGLLGSIVGDQEQYQVRFPGSFESGVLVFFSTESRHARHVDYLHAVPFVLTDVTGRALLPLPDGAPISLGEYLLQRGLARHGPAKEGDVEGSQPFAVVADLLGGFPVSRGHFLNSLGEALLDESISVVGFGGGAQLGRS